MAPASSRLSLSSLLAPLARPVRSPAPLVRRAPGGGARLAAAGPRAFGPVTQPSSGPAAEGLPVTLAGTPARQRDETTCGSMVLLMLAATGDPVLAEWLERGTLPPDLDRLPPEIPPDPTALTTTAARLEAAQQRLKNRTRSRALGPAPWPGRLGTVPWTAAREARFPGVRYRSIPMDDASPRAEALLTSVHGATTAGAAVPLYTGGDLSGGVAAAVPRHVVLAVPPPAAAEHRGRDDAGHPVLHLYDPASARVYAVPLAHLLARREPHPALGGWTHVCWVLLPVPD